MLFPTGIRDHDNIYMVRKLNHFRTNRHRVIQKRCLKHFNQELFKNDLGNVPWDGIQNENPNHQWEKWKALFRDRSEIIGGWGEGRAPIFVHMKNLKNLTLP